MDTVSKQPAEAVIEAYGAKVSLKIPEAAMLKAVIDGLPAGWTVTAGPGGDEEFAARFAVVPHPDGYVVGDARGAQALCPDRDLAVSMLRTMARRAVGSHGHELICIQAGVVAHKGRAILLPSQPLAGTSTLVDALVRAGAEHYADEFAMLDRDARVASSKEFEPDAARVPQRVPVALMALTLYRPGAVWEPRRLTAAEGVIALMAYTAAARSRPSETMATLRVALENADVLQGDRGDADQTARALLDALPEGASI